MGGPKITPAELDVVMTCRTYKECPEWYRKLRGQHSFYNTRRKLGLIGNDVTVPDNLIQLSPHFTSDKKEGTINWRDANKVIADVQQLRDDASYSQDYANIVFDVDAPICAVCLGDPHLGAFSSNHALFEAITDEILSIPNLYVILLGDILNLAIKLRSVSEVNDDIFPPGLVHAYFDSWLAEVAHKILCATWGNHDSEREESQSGSSLYTHLLSKRVIYHSGIGHADITVGDQTYKLALSHHFQGRSIYNPVHGAQRYLVMTDHDREIAACGDSHVPGKLMFIHGGVTKLAINTGSTQLNSRYAKRYFSLKTAPIFPCFELYPDQHRFVDYWSVGDWLASTQRAA